MSKVTEWVSPSCSPPEESDGEPLNVTVWIAESKFVHVTVSPTSTVSADGAKLNPLISIEWVVTTTAGLDVVVDAATVVVVASVEVVVAIVDVVVAVVAVVDVV